ncbi:unknown protein [Microcystis aeruginosa NIES-843]|uniref:Uncharacterized protein n=1 Tax=Microcystis aeruginosa (strain NIES-843 / IAM M-2473) TaxID=449447 RepID=B0JMU3_MICAN|nr:unknown protein [Microcystis aeruginosa NIES-843]
MTDIHARMLAKPVFVVTRIKKNGVMLILSSITPVRLSSANFLPFFNPGAIFIHPTAPKLVGVISGTFYAVLPTVSSDNRFPIPVPRDWKICVFFTKNCKYH